MKLLNLDELVTVARQIALGGDVYNVVDQSVGEMVNAIRVAKRIEDAKNDPEVILEAMIDTACRLIPSCPRDLLGTLTMQQLAALINFATAPDEDVMAAGAAGESMTTDEGTDAEKP